MALEKYYYEVIVQNVGRVYAGPSRVAALKKFSTYVKQSKGQYGRAAGSSVDLMRDGDVIKQHIGNIENPGSKLGKWIPAKAVKVSRSGKVQIKR